MVIFNKKFKKYNEIQLTKSKMDLNIRKMTNYPCESIDPTIHVYRSSKFLVTLKKKGAGFGEGGFYPNAADPMLVICTLRCTYMISIGSAA